MAGLVIWENMVNKLEAVLHVRVTSVCAVLDLHSTDMVTAEVWLCKDSYSFMKK